MKIFHIIKKHINSSISRIKGSIKKIFLWKSDCLLVLQTLFLHVIKIFSLLKGAIVVIFVSFGKVQTAIFFDKINFENFLLIKVYIQTLKNWERGSKIQNLLKPLLYRTRLPSFSILCTKYYYIVSSKIVQNNSLSSVS